MQGFLLQIDEAEIVAHEADDPNAFVDFLDSEALAGKDGRNVDALAMHADSPAGGDEDNIEALAAAGHEIGHTCFRVTSEGETALVWGDIVHVPSLQFARPDIAWEFDADQDQARASGLRIMALAADDRDAVAGAHLDSPGVGRVSRVGNSFSFDPL